MSEGTLVTLAVMAPVVILIVVAFVRLGRHARLSAAEDEERRANSWLHRRRFSSFLTRLGTLSPADTVATFEREHLPMRGSFSSRLAWPTLGELLPHVSAGELELLQKRFQELHAAAELLAVDTRDSSIKTDRAAMADLRHDFPEFSDSVLRRALGDERWYAMW